MSFFDLTISFFMATMFQSLVFMVMLVTKVNFGYSFHLKHIHPHPSSDKSVMTKVGHIVDIKFLQVIFVLRMEIKLH